MTYTAWPIRLAIKARVLGLVAMAQRDDDVSIGEERANCQYSAAHR